MRQIRGLYKKQAPDDCGLHHFRGSAEMLPSMLDKLDCRLGESPWRRFRSRGSVLVLKV